MDRVYLDNHATTRVDPRVIDAMLPYFGERFGNPSSRAHPFGQEAADAVEAARESVAAAIGAEPREIVFTSGATESNRLAIDAIASSRPGARIVASAIEHKSILERVAGRAAVVRPGTHGIVDAGEMAEAMAPGTGLVALMAANNEIGTLQPLEEVGRACRAKGIALLCDATAAIGRIPFDVRRVPVDFLAFSAHKIYGPKGAGVLYVRSAAGRSVARPGTPNVPGIVGLARALALCVAERESEAARMLALRTRLLGRLSSGLAGVAVNGELERRLPGNLNVRFDGIDGRALPVMLEGIAVSSGAACSTGAAEPSHVLLAIGCSREQALASLRFGIGRFNTENDVDRAADIVIAAVRNLRDQGGFRRGSLESDRVLGKTSHADSL
jgi:cysteine desulfurase